MSSEKLKSLQKLSVKELKGMCREANMTVSGTKHQLLTRLCGMEPEEPKTNRRQSEQQVNKWLEKQGVENIERVSDCLRAGIQRGHVDIGGDSPLDNVVVDGSCVRCRAEVTATIRDLIYQPESGHDYEEGGCRASVKCSKCNCGVYVTEICAGSVKCDSGKFHNHCTVCPGFGKCKGDYREVHCATCGGHYFAGNVVSLPCYRCNGPSYNYHDDD